MLFDNIDVTDTNNNRDFVKDSTIRFDLLLKPTERIIVALNLITHKMSVNDGDIRSTSPVIQAKLIDDKCILLGMMPPQPFPMEALSNVCIIHNLPLRQTEPVFFEQYIQVEDSTLRTFSILHSAANLTTGAITFDCPLRSRQNKANQTQFQGLLLAPLFCCFHVGAEGFH